MSQPKVSVVGTKVVGDSAVMFTFPCDGDKMVVEAMMGKMPLTTTKKLHESAVFIGVAQVLKNAIMQNPKDQFKFKVTHFAATIGDGYGSVSFTCVASKTGAPRIAKAVFKKLRATKALKFYNEAVKAVGEKPNREMFNSAYSDLVAGLKKDLSILFTGRGVDKNSKADLSAIAGAVGVAVKALEAADGKKTAPKVEKAEAVEMPNGFTVVSVPNQAGDLSLFMTKTYLATVLNTEVEYAGKSLLVHATQSRVDSVNDRDRIGNYAEQLAKKFTKSGMAPLVHMAASRAFGHADVLAKVGDEKATVTAIKGYIKMK